MKKRYIIEFSGVFERGYLRTTYTESSKTVKIEDYKNPVDFATKFRFKWWAKFICFLAQKSNEGILRTYQVKEILI